MKQKYLEAGKIAGTHGVRGDMRIESWCDKPEILASQHTLYIKSGDDFVPLRVTRGGVHKKMALIHFQGIDDIDAALVYKNHIVYADRDRIPVPEGGHFIADLVGLPVIDADDGHTYGTLHDVITGGHNDLYEIDTGAADYVLMPAVDEYVVRVDIDDGIFIRPIEGIFE